MYGEPKSKPAFIQNVQKLNKKKQVFLTDSKERR
jgi:hypothetical protein